MLGKAVPADGDQAGLLVQLQRLADRSGVEFQSIDLTSNAQSASAATTPSSGAGSSESPTPPVTPSADTAEDAAARPPPFRPPRRTEAAAATLPIGASVGPAGLPVMPYSLKFTGDFFQIANFLESLDELVHMPHGEVDVTGRLLTVDGFALAPEQSAAGASLSATPTLSADLSVTTYLTPADQGITAGATLERSGARYPDTGRPDSRVEHDDDPINGPDRERAGSDAMKSVRAPQLLTDLYRDLRDRRLLLPALALAVGSDRRPGGPLELAPRRRRRARARGDGRRIRQGEPPPSRRC